MKLNKYLPSLERVFQDYAIEASSRLGLNNFIRFLKEYQLLAKTEEEKGAEGYERVTIERAQIVFKQTVKQANAKLNFEQFLYALKLLSLDVYPAETMKAESMEVTQVEMTATEHKAFFALLSRNILKTKPLRNGEQEDGLVAAEAHIQTMLDAMQDDDVAELVKIL